MAATRDDLTLYLESSLVPIWGQDPGALTAAGIRYGLNNRGRYWRAPAGRQRGVWEKVAGFRRRLVRLELSSNNLVTGPSDFRDSASGSPWTKTGLTGFGARQSVIDKQTGYVQTGDGATADARRGQVVGTLTGNKETFYAIIQNIDAADSRVEIRDTTAGTPVIRAKYTWSTGVVTLDAGAGSVLAQKLGPNVVLLACIGSGTVSNGREVRIYPTNAAASSKSAIVHWGQLTAQALVTSPTDGVRPSEQALYPDLLSGANSFAVYTRLVQRFDAQDHPDATLPAVWSISNASTGNAKLLHEWSATGDLNAVFINGASTSFTASALNLDAVYGDVVESAVIWNRTASSLRIAARKNSGTVIEGSQTGLTLENFSAGNFYLNQRGDGTQRLAHDYSEVKVVDPAALDADPETNMTAVLNELERMRAAPGGEVSNFP